MNISHASVQTVTLDGKRFVILPEEDYRRLSGGPPQPELPPPDAEGNYPAREALRVVAARRLIRARRALGWSQVELARRAGVRVETLSRLEHAKHSASQATLEKVRRALDDGEADAARAKPTAGNRKPRK
ncbi:MAG TPA: helix-turn-helix transcriptional regulator [Pirellulales bacterium]|nr:helix-turn-helix transcriptional regulator [Pirellulales bacterium]